MCKPDARCPNAPPFYHLSRRSRGAPRGPRTKKGASLAASPVASRWIGLKVAFAKPAQFTPVLVKDCHALAGNNQPDNLMAAPLHGVAKVMGEPIHCIYSDRDKGRRLPPQWIKPQRMLPACWRPASQSCAQRIAPYCLGPLHPWPRPQPDARQAPIFRLAWQCALHPR